jgi:hypothetical protein
MAAVDEMDVPREGSSSGHLVYRLAYNGNVVAIKMGRRQGGPSRTGGRREHI